MYLWFLVFLFQPLILALVLRRRGKHHILILYMCCQCIYSLNIYRIFVFNMSFFLIFALTKLFPQQWLYWHRMQRRHLSMLRG